MNKLFIKAILKKVIEYLVFIPGYKAPEYAYVRVTKNSNKNIYCDKF